MSTNVRSAPNDGAAQPVCNSYQRYSPLYLYLHTYRSIDFSCHLEAKDADKESEWFAPLPDLSNVAIKQNVKEEEVEDHSTDYNIVGVR